VVALALVMVVDMTQAVRAVGNRFVLEDCLRPHDMLAVVLVEEGIQYYCCNWLLIHSLALIDRWV